MEELNDAEHGHGWGPERSIDADLLIDLLTGQHHTIGKPIRAIKLCGARIVGNLDLEARTLTSPLLLRACWIDQPINLDEATAPAVRLPGSYVPSITADELRITGSLELTMGFTTGNVRLIGARIGGQLDLSGADLGNTGDIALYADGVHIEQGMFFCDGFIAAGEIRLIGAHITSQLDMTGAQLYNPDGNVLTADGLTIDQDMYCRHGFTAEGEIRLLGAHITGQLDVSGAVLRNPDAVTMDLEDAQIGHLRFLPAATPDGVVDLTNLQVKVFDDDQTTWPLAGRLRLRGFVYQTLNNEKVSVRDRLDWLNRHPGRYTPQIYDQLAAALRNAGHSEAARRVGITKQWRRRHRLNPLNWLLYATVGYGYRTWFAAVWLAVLVVIGTLVFDHAAATGHVHHQPGAPAFHPFAYALDVVIPIVDLGQRRFWTPDGTTLYWSWTLIAAGWLLTTAAVAGLTGIFKRD